MVEQEKPKRNILRKIGIAAGAAGIVGLAALRLAGLAGFADVETREGKKMPILATPEKDVSSLDSLFEEPVMVKLMNGSKIPEDALDFYFVFEGNVGDNLWYGLREKHGAKVRWFFGHEIGLKSSRHYISPYFIIDSEKSANDYLVISLETDDRKIPLAEVIYTAGDSLYLKWTRPEFDEVGYPTRASINETFKKLKPYKAVFILEDEIVELDYPTGNIERDYAIGRNIIKKYMDEEFVSTTMKPVTYAVYSTVVESLLEDGRPKLESAFKTLKEE